MSKVPIKDKIYFHKDIIQHVVKAGVDKNFAECFFEWLAVEINNATQDPEIVDVTISNFGTIFLSLQGCIVEINSNERFFEKKIIDEFKYRNKKEFLENKLELIYKRLEELQNRKAKGMNSKFRRKAVKLNVAKNV